MVPRRSTVAVDYARQILAAIRFAHRHGIVHRDIKPHNVLVDGEGRLKVTDFGIARAGVSQMTEAGSIIGTAQYLSPEQAKGAPVDQTSDLYSVGVVLYELLTGEVPFTGDTPVEIAMKHLSTVPEPPSAKRADIPAGPRPGRHARTWQGPLGALPERGGDGRGPPPRQPRRRDLSRHRGGRDRDHLAAAALGRHGDHVPRAEATGSLRTALRLLRLRRAFEARAVAVVRRAAVRDGGARRRVLPLLPDPGPAQLDRRRSPSATTSGSARPTWFR